MKKVTSLLILATACAVTLLTSSASAGHDEPASADLTLLANGVEAIDTSTDATDVLSSCNPTLNATSSTFDLTLRSAGQCDETFFGPDFRHCIVGCNLRGCAFDEFRASDSTCSCKEFNAFPTMK